MSARITRKRARVESEDDNSSGGQDRGPPRKRDEELWYEDGNIIIIAGDTEFRVYKGILSDHSPIFKDMFSLPQPSSSSSAEPACPVVHITDSPQDLRHVLRLCMPKMVPSPFEPSEPSFDVVSASIRLGHKYQIPHLVDHAVAYLKRYYPGRDGYDDWAKSGCSRPPNFQAVHAIGVINLARLVEDDTLLPAAYLACSELEAQIAHGFTREDGFCEHLSQEDLGKCFRAKGVLVTVCYVNAGLVYDPTPSRHCPRGTGCGQELQAMLGEFLSGIPTLACGDPLTLPLCTLGNVEKRVCRACYRMVRQREETARRKTWQCLPTLLGLKVQGWGASAGDASSA